MSEFTVEPESSETEIVTTETDIPVVTAEISFDADVEVENIYTVEAQINEWQLVNDMIYMVNEAGPPPDWLETAIEEIINDPDGLLVDSIEELYRLFAQFEDGYEHRLYTVETDNSTQYTEIESLVVKTDDNSAGIVEIKDVYVSEERATAISTDIVGAYLNDGELGGAWFENSVSAVADVAYSAARSASSLNAVTSSQADDLSEIWGTLNDLEKQIDGVLETFFYENSGGNVGPNIINSGEIDITSEPYATWQTDGSKSLHTGDSYVLYEVDANGDQVYISSWRFGLSTINEPTTDSEGYVWLIVTDSRAEEAYQLALNAQITADSKVNTFFKLLAPTLTDAGLLPGEACKMTGDIWYSKEIVGYEDEAETIPIYDGTMKRYDCLGNNTWSADNWKEVSDHRIQASVDRIEEAFVTVGGYAAAESSLVLDAEGHITGVRRYASTNPNDPGSQYKIFADKFFVTGQYDPENPGAGFSVAPFSIDTTGTVDKIHFSGTVEFDNINNMEMPDPVDLTPYMTNAYADQFYTRYSDLATAATSTIINGYNIRTGYVSADRISVSYLSALSANLGTVNAGVMYNYGANSTNYTFMINLSGGEIHIR